MKIILFSLLFSFCFVFAGQAQSKYSLENLETLSQENLDIYLKKAMKLQQSGRSVNLAGAILFGAGAVGITYAIAVNDDSYLIAGAIGFLGVVGGLGTFAVGLPMSMTGKNRVDRIRYVKDKQASSLRLNVRPGVHYDLMAHKYHPGVSIGFMF